MAADRVTWIIRFFVWGEDGTKQFWIFPLTLMGTCFAVEAFTDWGRSFELFQRSGAAATSILVPLFAYHFGQVSRWRAFQYAEEAKVEFRNTLKTQMQVKSKASSVPFDHEWAEEVLKVKSLEADTNALKETLDKLEPSLNGLHATAISMSTAVWGFGDLIFAGKSLAC